jgi:hypothetical protein
MAAAVTAVVRGVRAFSGGTTARVVDDMGADVTGCHGPRLPRRNDRACACTRSFRQGGARLSAVDDITWS